jgi:hypothetical protein
VGETAHREIHDLSLGEQERVGDTKTLRLRAATAAPL